MAYISQAFGLPQDVPFVDVDVERDNRVFVDPSAIRNGTCPYSIRAQERLVHFFEEVVRRRRSPELTDRIRGLTSLQRMREPGQTRMGYSVQGTNGKGFGDVLGQTLWEALADPLCCNEALRRIEHLPLFLDRVDSDLISDMVTRIVMDILMDFTHEMMIRYPELAQTTTTENIMVWDVKTLEWSEREIELPFIGGKQLILVPIGWVSKALLMRARPFYNCHTTQEEQAELTIYDRDGNPERPSKKDIKAKHPEVKLFNRDRTMRDLGKVKHVTRYQQDVDLRFTPMDAVRIREQLNKNLDIAS
jgi:hypothetical protein